MKKLSLLAAALCASVSFDLRAEVVEIATPEDFATQIPANPAGDFKLTANIDLTGVTYERPACFSGSLDGQGHTISGLATQFCLTNAGTLAAVTFDGTTDGTNRKFSGADVGAISCFAKDASYTDVIVKGYSLSTGRGRAGFFAASAEGEMRFTRCATDASCIIQKGSNNNNNNGGFIGRLTGLASVDAVFECCTNNAALYKIGDANDSQCTAGFVASVKGGDKQENGYPALRFTKCVNRGSITAEGGRGSMSGFVGMTEQGFNNMYSQGTLRIVLVDCVNEGDIGAGDYAVVNSAGFIAQLGSGVTFVLTNCVNRGAIGGSASSRASGFVGWMASHICTKGDAKSFFVNCANYGDVTGVSAAGMFTGGATGTGARNADVPGFYNCANYGTINGSAAEGEFASMVPSNFSLALDNCYSDTGNHAVAGGGAGTFTATAMHGPYETGYDAQAACEALAARAELYGWDKWWKVGKVSGKPELLQWSGDVIVVCKVRYLDWDGTVLKESQVEKGTADLPPENPAREGYVFIGWDKSTDCVTEDMDVTAQYRERVAGEIGSPADFLSAMENPSGSYFLANDIDLTDSGYVTISEFSGRLDGAGHVLSGLGAQQLFVTNSGVVVDLTLDGTTLAGPTAVNGTEIGVLCNIADGAAFTNVIVRGYKLRHDKDVSQKYIGLFAAKAYGGTEFVRCETGADASVGQPSGKRNCGQGGFVGSVVTSTESGVVAMFVDCTNRAEIVYEAGNGTDGWGSGGFVGKVSVGSGDGVPEVRFVRCVNFGAVNGQHVGGIVGVGSTIDNSKPGKTFFEGCVNYGAFGTGPKCVGGIVGSQTFSNNTGMGMSFTNCVNYGTISAATENAGGIVGSSQGARNNATMGLIQYSSCANYADITSTGNAGGIIGKARDKGDYGASLKAVVDNCANYGALSGMNAGQMIGLLGPRGGDNSSTSAVLDNCFGLTASPVGHYEEPLKEFTMTNMKSAADEGYTPSAAKKALNAVADEKGYENWVLGKVGGVDYPELGIFCTNPCGGGLMLLFR